MFLLKEKVHCEAQPYCKCFDGNGQWTKMELEVEGRLAS